MPVFDFECGQCKKKFTELALGAEIIVCPHCNSAKLKKLFSPFYTVSDATRYETGAKDLPSMEQWARAKQKRPADTRGVRHKKKTGEKVQRLKTKNLKPRAAVHKKAAR